MIDDKKRELLKKLRALAQRGEAGEREVAQQRLAELLIKYNVCEAELSDDALELHKFTFHNDFQRKLLIQLFYKIAPDRNYFRYTRGPGKYSVREIECTKAEALQIGIEYEFYSRLWAEEVEFFLSAFIQKHRIFDERPGHKSQEVDDETIFRMNMMMGAMQDKSVLPMIEQEVGG